MSYLGPANYSTILEAVPELIHLGDAQPSRSIYAGGQNFTYVCLRAINESLQVLNGSIAFRNPHFFKPATTISEIQDTLLYGPLCNSVHPSAPLVQVPYRWCATNCWGWEVSHPTSLSQWIGPLVQFILPCLAFCLSIPRSWKFRLPEWVFESQADNTVAFIGYFIKLTFAFFIVTSDTLVWLSICFAFAGPMLLSAMYEYTLDRKILDFLLPRIHTRPNIPDVTKARLLLAAVLGNIKLDVDGGQRNNVGRPGAAAQPNLQVNAAQNGVIWTQIMEIAESLNAPQQSTVGPDLKLKALLNAQSSFGGAVGAPVVFFIGSFVYNIIEADTRIGDNDTAHALAFGMWWMTISHIAVISSAMLATNNPSALQGIIGTARNANVAPINWLSRSRQTWEDFLFFLSGGMLNNANCNTSWVKALRWTRDSQTIENAYDSTFKPVSLWKRGPNKQLWVNKAVQAYRNEGIDGFHISCEDLQVRFKIGWSTWASISVQIVTVLLGAPFVLAFATSYTTPVRGLGCRSLTHLVYFITQLIQMMLWGWNLHLSQRNRTTWKIYVCRFLRALVGGCAIFAAIGGTLMQIIGVYRNCICKMSAWAWTNRDHPEAVISLSYISQESIKVSFVWKITGSLASSILAMVAALAWWHQRRLRRKFLAEAEALQNAAISLGNVPKPFMPDKPPKCPGGHT